jgi:hypothetical protein
LAQPDGLRPSHIGAPGLELSTFSARSQTSSVPSYPQVTRFDAQMATYKEKPKKRRKWKRAAENTQTPR